MEPSQIAAIEAAPLFDGERHPAWGPLFDKKAGPTDIMSRRAADAVWQSPNLRQAMRGTLQRAAALTNIPDAAAAMAELRALGSMLEAGMNPRPLPTGSGRRGSTPDFEADAGDGPVTIEVHAKHEHGAQTLRRRALAAGEDVSEIERTITELGGDWRLISTVSVWHPGGAPDSDKPNDSVQTNLISKICAVKGAEHQRRAGVPAVLWLDLNSFDPMSENLLEQMDPLESTPIGLISGALWHAFYGWKGAPILEDWHRQVLTMAHDGRFRTTGARKSQLAAAIVCIERGLVLYENPWADVRLPAAFRHRCQRLPWFKIAPSIADWAPGGAAGRVALAEAQIEAIAATRLTVAAASETGPSG